MAETQFVEVKPGIKLHVQSWPGEKRPFLLLHGLSSNATTWLPVARQLAAAGHAVTAVDQRGHGLSDKPEDGYDYETVTSDLRQSMEALALERPFLVGQSWGGNVVLAFGARYPGQAQALIGIDGGVIDMQADPANTWEQVSQQFKPPDWRGVSYQTMWDNMRTWHPDWTDEAITITLNNFERLPDDTITPRLTLARHLKILHALWAERPLTWLPSISDPVYLAMAGTGDPQWTARKTAQAAAISAALPNVTVRWFPDTDHDIHVHRPQALAAWLLEISG